MKAVNAYIKTSREDHVIDELSQIKGLTGVSVFDIKEGYGRDRSGSVMITDSTDNYVPHVKIEIYCKEDLVERVCSAILKGAHTGLREDGKIYVLPVEKAIRISTGLEGKDAV